jgi:hypothetical protein
VSVAARNSSVQLGYIKQTQNVDALEHFVLLNAQVKFIVKKQSLRLNLSVLKLQETAIWNAVPTAVKNS